MDTNKRDQWKTLATTDNLNTANEAVASVEWVEDNQRYQLTGEVSLQRSSIIQSSLRLEIYGKQVKMADLTPLRIFLLLPTDVDWAISKKKYKTRSTGKEALAVAMSFNKTQPASRISKSSCLRRQESVSEKLSCLRIRNSERKTNN